MYQDWIARGEVLFSRVWLYDFQGLWAQVSQEPVHLAAAAVAILAVLLLSRSFLLALATACIAAVLIAALIGLAVPRNATLVLLGVASFAILVGGWKSRRRYMREVSRRDAVVEEKAEVQKRLDDEIRWRIAAETTSPKAAAGAPAGGTVRVGEPLSDV